MRRYIICAVLFLFAISLPTSSQAQKKAQDKKTGVIIYTATKKAFTDKSEALGTLRANESVDLTSTVTEKVTDITFKDNQTVKKGDVLIRMDIMEEQAELAEQRSILNEAQRQVKRLEPLIKSGAASKSILDEWRKELSTAKARIKGIQARIEQRIIRAPYDGVLGMRNISVGALIQPGSMITTVDDISVMKLDFSVAEVYLSSVKPGVKIKAKSRAYPDKEFIGKISSIDSRINPVTRSFMARAILSNNDKNLRPGQLMTIELYKNPRQALVIPEETLTADGFDSYVFVLNGEPDNYTLERRKVILGARHFGEVEVLDGLKSGDMVVIHGLIKARDGMSVFIQAEEQNNETLSQMLKQETPDTLKIK
jgi:membrane fusion protein (multidrug efflux system)